MKRALCLFAVLSGLIVTNVSTTYASDSARRKGIRTAAIQTQEGTERVRTLHRTVAKTAKVIAGACLAVQAVQAATTAFHTPCTNADRQEATQSFAYSLASGVGAGAYYLFDKYMTCLFLNSAFDQLADFTSFTQPEEDE